MPDIQRTIQSNGQQRTAPNHQLIQAMSGGGQLVIVKYNENWMTLNIAGDQVLHVKFNHSGGMCLSMGEGQGSVMRMTSNGMRIQVRGGLAIDVKMRRYRVKINVGGGRVFRVRYDDANGTTVTLSQDGVRVRPPTAENAAAPQPPPAVAPQPPPAVAPQPPPAVAPQPPPAVVRQPPTPLLGFSDADIDRVSTTFNYVEPPEKSSSTKDGDTCSICLEPFKADECMRKLRCGHEFHSSCVVPWLRRQTTCPNCRRKISLKR